MKWIVLTVAIVLNATANILIKAAMRDVGALTPSPSGLLQLATNLYLVMGVIAFGLALGAYSYTLTQFPLSIAYPTMTSLGLVVVATASVIMFGETFTLSKLIGSGLILFGVILVARAA